MRKISLIPYRVNGNQAYAVRESLVDALFGIRLGPQDLKKHDQIAGKIETAENNEVLLEEDEYEKLVFCIRSFPQGYGRADLEFVNRVMDAEEITVKEA